MGALIACLSKELFSAACLLVEKRIERVTECVGGGNYRQKTNSSQCVAFCEVVIVAVFCCCHHCYCAGRVGQMPPLRESFGSATEPLSSSRRQKRVSREKRKKETEREQRQKEKESKSRHNPTATATTTITGTSVATNIATASTFTSTFTSTAIATKKALKSAAAWMPLLWWQCLLLLQSTHDRRKVRVERLSCRTHTSVC